MPTHTTSELKCRYNILVPMLIKVELPNIIIFVAVLTLSTQYMHNIISVKKYAEL